MGDCALQRLTCLAAVLFARPTYSVVLCTTRLDDRTADVNEAVGPKFSRAARAGKCTGIFPGNFRALRAQAYFESDLEKSLASPKRVSFLVVEKPLCQQYM